MGKVYFQKTDGFFAISDGIELKRELCHRYKYCKRSKFDNSTGMGPVI